MNQISLRIFSLLLITIFICISIYNSYYDQNIIKSYVGQGVNSIIMIIIGIATIYALFNRDNYLPFLGLSHMPTSMFKDYKQDKFDKKITIEITDKNKGVKPIKVLYWASNPSAEIKTNPRDAYGNYENYGIAPIVDNKADLYVKCPGTYNVTRGKVVKITKPLPKHVHYRVIYDNGIASRIKTMNIEC